MSLYPHRCLCPARRGSLGRGQPQPFSLSLGYRRSAPGYESMALYLHLPIVYRRRLAPASQLLTARPGILRQAPSASGGGHPGSNAHTARTSYRVVICASGRTATPPRLLAAPGTPDTHTTSGRPSVDLRRPRFLERTQCEPRQDSSAWRPMPILASPKPHQPAPPLTARQGPSSRGINGWEAPALSVRHEATDDEADPDHQPGPRVQSSPVELHVSNPEDWNAGPRKCTPNRTSPQRRDQQRPREKPGKRQHDDDIQPEREDPTNDCPSPEPQAASEMRSICGHANIHSPILRRSWVRCRPKEAPPVSHRCSRPTA